MALAYDELSWDFVQAGDIKIHYGEIGEGPPLICLHGTGPGASAWSNFRHNVGALAEGHRVVLMDFPRFGKSQKLVIEAPRLTFLSGVLRDFMKEVDLDSTHLMGNSMGGQVAIKLAVDSPELVNKLVLVGNAITNKSVMAAMPTETVRMIMEYYRGGDGPSREKMRLLLRSLVYNPDSVTEELLEERYQASIDPDVLEVNKGPHWAWERVDDQLGEVSAETLIIWGFEDRASPFDHAILMLQHLQDARLYLLSKSGHAVHAEKPEEFNRVVTEFLTA